MLRLRHAFRLAGDFGHYARVNQAWWLLLIAPIIAFAILAVGGTQVVVPYTVYTLF
jgi:hypothetical protein